MLQAKPKAMFYIPSKPSPSEVVEKISSKKVLDSNERILMPSNHAFILLNTGERITRSIIGSIGKTHIEKGDIYIFSSQSRGVTLSSDKLSYSYARINPEYTQAFFPTTSNLSRDCFEKLSSNQITWSVVHFEMYIQELCNKLDANGICKTTLDTLALIREHNGDIKIKEIYDQLGISKSFLEQKFFAAIGLSPKEFCKIEKMKNFIALYKQFCQDMNLTQLTYKSGYYDQSHLNKDIQYFMGSNPREFVKTQ